MIGRMDDQPYPPSLRREDRRFLAGRGRFADDLAPPDAAHGAVLRSPHPHARIRRIDTAAALAVPGVLAVLTAADAAADRLGPLPCIFPMRNRDGSLCFDPLRGLLAGERVRYVGEPVGFVVAETLAAARDAAELVEVDYEPLPHVVQTDRAKAGPALYEECPDNVCVDWEMGDAAKVDRALAGAAHRVSVRLANNRVAVAPVEPRAAWATYDAAHDSLTLTTPSQGVFWIRDPLARHVFAMPPERLRVVTPDVGGGFGMKLYPYPEQGLVCWAARRLGRTVRWVAERTESFLADTAGRDHVSELELGLDAEGRFLALRAHSVAALGACLSAFAPSIPTAGFAKLLTSVYRVPAAYVHVEGVFTNTAPVDAYRGAGKPEAQHALERLIERAAEATGIDRIELRRRNLVGPAEMPYRTATRQTFDSGDFPACLEALLAAADAAGFAARREAAAVRGRLAGLGIVPYIHATGGMPEDEVAEVTVLPEGRVRAVTGTQSSGQGHEGVLAWLVAERLGVRPEEVELVQGDSAAMPKGGGTGGSSSLLISGNTLVAAADQAIERGRALAAHLMEAAVADVEYADAGFRIVGTDRRLSLYEVAARGALASDLPEDLGGGIGGCVPYTSGHVSFPNGWMAAEVEVDPETGRTALVRFTTVDDVGRAVSPAIVAGQMHGGIAQGVGQALLEEAFYDPGSGQMLAASLMDYCLPRADDLPFIDRAERPTPTEASPLGAKGVGECGPIGAPAAVMCALLDALKPAGVRELEMPATAEKVWRALRAAHA